MATPNMDEPLDIVEQRLTEIQVECRRHWCCSRRIYDFQS
ncbi:hypothetical protein PanWU01x14_232170 [Parasponia andersonii]|uniref:Uncharacterized protein n=1 Tax=Parasponia andersonii TaxID=3476 RepID=A0A2P5BK19_PARAD|nr:hypothetical protein PanWU01x14_232170 [Parasponia andersonii]